MDVGKRLRQLRDQCGYSQNNLAERAGVSQTHLRNVELGNADITISHLQLICDALAISLKDFFNVDDEQEELSAAISRLSPKQKRILLDFLKTI